MKSFLLSIDWSLVKLGMVILGMGVFTVVVETIVMLIFKEAWLIKLLNTNMGWGRILVTSLVMNLLSFATLYLIFTKFLARFFSV